MSETLGKPVAAENRTGGFGLIGARAALAARPDGHTVMMAPLSFLAAPLMMDPQPYDPIRAFRAITHLDAIPYLLLVRADAPVRDIASFHTWVATHPTGLNYASSGNGTPLHLAGEMYRLMTGTRLTSIAYRGTGPAIAALIAREVHMVFADLPAAVGHIRAGTVGPLAVLGQEALEALPGVPTLASSDPRLAEYEVHTWVMLVTPRGVPDDPVARLNAAALAAMLAPDVSQRLAPMGFSVTGSAREAGDAFLAREQARWGSVITRAGIAADF